MIVADQLVEVKWAGANRKQLESHGYIYTKLYDVIKISVEHLAEKSHVKIKIICDTCGDEKLKKRYSIDLNGNHFCNSKCYGQWLKNSVEAKSIHEKRKNRIKTNCKHCDVEINKKPSEFIGHGKHYCSRSCMGSHRMETNNPNPKIDKTVTKCEQCSFEFDIHESQYKNNKWHFCSRECYYTYRSENLIGDKAYNYQDIIEKCDSCGIDTKVTKYQLSNRKNIFCSQECYYKYRAIFYIGENHPQYGTKKTPEQIDHMRIVTSNRIANGEFPQTNTAIQVKTRKFVEELNLSFKEEIQFKYYVLDFYDEINNLAIEVMGDYWHASPIKYEEYDSLHDIQKKDIKRDKSKNTYLKKYHEISVLYLWEDDINNNPDLCKQLLTEYVKNKGLLEDYNSFNYTYIDDLLLNPYIIKPYFKRANTNLQKC